MHAVIAYGSHAQHIVAAAHSCKADLIVAGAPGDATAELDVSIDYILRQARCSVLVVNVAKKMTP
jgi:nucleotide-binding universal stress UspA family protein